MATPDAISSIYLEDVVSGFDVLKPEKLNKLFRRYGDQGVGYFQTIRSLGFEQSVSRDTYGHFEEDFIHESFSARSNVADPGVGNSVDVTFSTDDLDSSNNY